MDQVGSGVLQLVLDKLLQPRRTSGAAQQTSTGSSIPEISQQPLTDKDARQTDDLHRVVQWCDEMMGAERLVAGPQVQEKCGAFVAKGVCCPFRPRSCCQLRCGRYGDVVVSCCE